MKKKVARMAIFLALCVISFNTKVNAGQTDENKTIDNDEGINLYIIIGDSRETSMYNGCNEDSNLTKIAENTSEDYQVGSALFKNNFNNDMYLLDFHSGGSMTNGAYSKSISSVTLSLIYIYDIYRINEITVFEMYGANDIPYSKANLSMDTVIDDYFTSDAMFYEEILNLDCPLTFYKTTVGQINPEGIVYKEKRFLNTDVATFNNDLYSKETENIKVFPLEEWITESNITCLVTDSDPYGIHYSHSDSNKIFWYLVDSCN